MDVVAETERFKWKKEEILRRTKLVQEGGDEKLVLTLIFPATINIFYCLLFIYNTRLRALKEREKIWAQEIEIYEILESENERLHEMLKGACYFLL